MELKPKRGVRCIHSLAVVAESRAAEGSCDSMEKNLDDSTAVLKEYLSLQGFPQVRHSEMDDVGYRKVPHDDHTCSDFADSVDIDCSVEVDFHSWMDKNAASHEPALAVEEHQADTKNYESDGGGWYFRMRSWSVVNNQMN